MFSNATESSESLSESQRQSNESDNVKSKLEESVEEKLKEIELDYEKRLNKSVEQINNDYDNLSLQTKIVNYLLYFNFYSKSKIIYII